MSETKHTYPSPPLIRFFSQSISIPPVLHPFLFLSLSLINRQTHLFAIDILLSIRGGRMVEEELAEVEGKRGVGRGMV